MKVANCQIGAHRISWEIHRGPIPEGMSVCHHCDVPTCVNPEHLFIGTHADNMSDMKRKGRQARGEHQGLARLTRKQVLAIREDPRSQTAIAKDYGVHQPHISKIKRREIWSHI